ncbi:MAG: phenylalanine--tRNA ligase subunit beta [Candidatus Kapaibacteriota bacterium]
MKISFNLLTEFIQLTQSPKEVAEILTSIGFEVEEYIDFNEKYKHFVVGVITSCEKISEKLSFCNVSDGDRIYDIVCGAPNVDIGQKVVLALPGAIIPKNNTLIQPTIIRGYTSQGMICSEDELAIGDCSTEILVLDNDAPIGKPFADYFELNDIVYEIGITPNRGDCLSHLGIARELSAYLDLPLKLPAIDLEEEESTDINDFVSVEVLDTEKCPRYTARLILDVSFAESPIWLKSSLIKLGLRSINPIVDVTNYVMLELGQPLHAFDYDKLSQRKIIVKTATEGEKFITLDGKERELDKNILMICDGEKPVAIGGVMGGENSEIGIGTKNVLLESAFFNPVSIRRTTKKLGLSSESSYRFERGVDYGNTLFALNRAAQLITSLCKGKLASGCIDVYPKPFPKKQVAFRFDRARKVIGADISNESIRKILYGLHFKPLKQNLEQVVFEVPSYRFDVEQEIDLIEEVARFYGYDNITEDTSYNISYSGGTQKNQLELPELRAKIKDYFVARGFTEILTPNLYSPQKTKLFYDGDFIEIANPLGEEFSIVRPSIIPSLLEVVKFNINIGKKDLKLFEIGKQFIKDRNSWKFIEGINEQEILGVALSGLSYPFQWGMNNRKFDFYDAKGIVRHFLHSFGIEYEEDLTKSNEDEIFAGEFARIFISGEFLGYYGAVSEKVKKFFDIEEDIYLIVIYLEKIYLQEQKLSKYQKISQFPIVRRDLAFIVDEIVEAETIYNIIKASAGEYLRDIVLFDVFKGKNIGEGKKNLAFALYFNSHERTLTDEEVQLWLDNIVAIVKAKTGGELRAF